MALLPVVVPDIPESRSGVVAARLARKVAPLFGVPWAAAPFDLTWVCDYTSVTLSEIARGAPQPNRAVAPTDEPWTVVGRAVAASGKLPNEIAAATLNRFGPDTKAAVVLTGVNALFHPVTTAIADAVAFLDRECGDLPTRLRLAGWAAMTLEAFRSQPALFVAGIQARSIQRAALTHWRLPRPTDPDLARCEIGAPRTGAWPPGAATSPDTLDIADQTIAAVRPPNLGTDPAPELVDRWLRRLAAMGTVDGDGYLWLRERSPGHRVVESYIPQTPTIGAYLESAAHLLGNAPTPSRLPRIPDQVDLPPLAARAVVLALTAMIRDIRFDPHQREDTRSELLGTLDRLTALADNALGPADPLTAITRCRAADIRVHTLRHNLDNNLRRPLRQLADALDQCRQLAPLDPGAVAEILHSSNVELNVVLRHNLPPGRLHNATQARLRDAWAEFLTLTEIDVDALADQPADARERAGYHLNAYASHLAGRDSPDELHHALDLYRDLVIPAREQRFHRTGQFQPLRQTLQTASRATSELALRAHADGRHDDARQWASLGRAWITTALDNPHTQHLITARTEPAAHFALLAARALLVSARVHSPDTTTNDVDTAATLLNLARAYATNVANGGQYARQPDIDHIEQLLADARATAFPVRHNTM